MLIVQTMSDCDIWYTHFISGTFVHVMQTNWSCKHMKLALLFITIDYLFCSALWITLAKHVIVMSLIWRHCLTKTHIQGVFKNSRKRFTVGSDNFRLIGPNLFNISKNAFLKSYSFAKVVIPNHFFFTFELVYQIGVISYLGKTSAIFVKNYI